ncbi:hypothetical protein [Winogradskyella endarachnes]|uniref:Uncharacterized protein n=1 Tax=Winogradskyella endarachnes TaxID=2681965 RepID=A0A6L6U9G1_9FLAO|nr:hypothetical protein [Winogradskyella endarachnes]MUU78961.1 hypothetical protein [Winogradskyella endarachnes]
MSPIYKPTFICLLFLVLTTSCKNENKVTAETPKPVVEVKEEKELSPIERIEKAYNKDEFLSRKAIEVDMVIKFGGKERLDAKMTYLTNST